MALTCPHFRTCGGCDQLNTPVAQQRSAKRDAVLDTLGEHVAGLTVSFTDTADREPRHDRMRILYPIQPDTAGHVTMGLYRRGTHSPIVIETCELQHPALTTLGRRARQIFRNRNIEPYDERTHEGALRAFSARLSASTGELLIGVITTEAKLNDARGIARELQAATTDLTAGRGKPVRTVGVVHNVHRARGNHLIGTESQTLSGRDHLFDKADGLAFRIGFHSFYQLHRRADRMLYGPAMEMLAPHLKGAHVVDGFGGVGTFGLRCRRAGAASVTLVEANPHACADARANAEANQLEIDVVTGDFQSAPLPSSVDVLVVDPSRKGIESEGCERIESMAPDHLLYVACGLKGLARDLDRLPSYEVVDVRLADLFPHTPHVETLALCRRRSAPASPPAGSPG